MELSSLQFLFCRTFETMSIRILFLLLYITSCFYACAPDHAQVIVRTRDYAEESTTLIDFIQQSELYVCETKNILEHRFFENNRQLIFDRTDQQEVNDLHSAVTRLPASYALTQQIKDSLLLCLSNFNRLADRIITQQNPNNETLGDKLSNTVANWVGIDINQPFFDEKDALYQQLNHITLLQDQLRNDLKEKLDDRLLLRLNEETVLIYNKPLTRVHPLFLEALDTMHHIVNKRFRTNPIVTNMASNCSVQTRVLFPEK